VYKGKLNSFRKSAGSQPPQVALCQPQHGIFPSGKRSAWSQYPCPTIFRPTVWQETITSLCDRSHSKEEIDKSAFLKIVATATKRNDNRHLHTLGHSLPLWRLSMVQFSQTVGTRLLSASGHLLRFDFWQIKH
jgi:hypothetical protein